MLEKLLRRVALMDGIPQHEVVHDDTIHHDFRRVLRESGLNRDEMVPFVGRIFSLRWSKKLRGNRGRSSS